MKTTSASGTALIITVTPNPALDVTYHVDGIRLGESHRVPAGTDRAGGKGLNVARVAHEQGCPVLAIAPVGGHNGRLLAAELTASGVPHRLVPVTAGTRRTITFVDTRSGQTSIFNEHGAALTASEWDALAGEIEQSLNHAGREAPFPGVLVGSGSLPAGAPPQFYAALVRLAHSHGIPAVIDTSGPGMLAAARAGADLLKPNREELHQATGIQDPVTASQELLRLGARRILVSAGEDGMLAFDADAPSVCWAARLPHPLQGNPTGAGDAAGAAAAVELASGRESIRSILRSATSWSAAAVLMPVAGQISPRYRELEQELIITERAV
ncbi:hexose kinase [Arthrobacter sp. ISL-48]|uniref:1-phosphofructokinase family hexose kinase n=1 Tax=Arthrobacter sp. ISL-48 TaxID=2819110 RepID=UPI001BE72603|nr:hexose kinase [Arthrobacter sp. ISL-48]MBT2532585.1 hexose kinase [Arthrobacter sp. ISL-48]